LKGYRIEGQDNDSYAYSGRTDVQRCPVCRALTDKWSESLAGFKINKLRKKDISATYDGALIVSLRFKEVCEQSRISGAVFLQLPDDPAFYRLDASTIVAFDTDKAQTRFIKQCNQCKIYESVVGTTPFNLKAGQTIPVRSFAKTVLEFASLDEKHPILICDDQAGEILKRSKLKGLELLAVRL